jgi:hypothetical protein
MGFKGTVRSNEGLQVNTSNTNQVQGRVSGTGGLKSNVSSSKGIQITMSGAKQVQGGVSGTGSLKLNNTSLKRGARVSEITLLAAAWVGDDSPYSQVVTIDKVTKNSKIDLQPSVEQLVAFHDKDLAFVTENDDGVITVYAIGDRPTKDYTIQVTITEVAV